MENQNLLIHFCGTKESTFCHFERFIPAVRARYQVFIKGMGAKESTPDIIKDWGKKANAVIKFEKHNLKLKKEILPNIILRTISTEGNGDMGPREILFIEPKYTGNAVLGFKLVDSESVGYGTLMALHKWLEMKKIKDIKNIVMSSHSRGAAVALPSFIYAVHAKKDKLASQYSSVHALFTEMERMRTIFLDPVSGRAISNEYHMGQNWNCGEMYKKMIQVFREKIKTFEFFANAAPFEQAGAIVDKVITMYPTSKRFLLEPKKFPTKIKLGKDVTRYFLGFRHSSVISPSEPYNEFYEKGYSPFDLVCNFINDRLKTIEPEVPNPWTYALTDRMVLESMPEKYKMKIRITIGHRYRKEKKKIQASALVSGGPSNHSHYFSRDPGSLFLERMCKLYAFKSNDQKEVLIAEFSLKGLDRTPPLPFLILLSADPMSVVFLDKFFHKAIESKFDGVNKLLAFYKSLEENVAEEVKPEIVRHKDRLQKWQKYLGDNKFTNLRLKSYTAMHSGHMEGGKSTPLFPQEHEELENKITRFAKLYNPETYGVPGEWEKIGVNFKETPKKT